MRSCCHGGGEGLLASRGLETHEGSWGCGPLPAPVSVPMGGSAILVKRVTALPLWAFPIIAKRDCHRDESNRQTTSAAPRTPRPCAWIVLPVGSAPRGGSREALLYQRRLHVRPFGAPRARSSSQAGQSGPFLARNGPGPVKEATGECSALFCQHSARVWDLQTWRVGYAYT